MIRPQDGPSTLVYCFDHMRLLTAPLFGHVPIVFVAPNGPGLKQAASTRPTNFGPFLMPQTTEG